MKVLSGRISVFSLLLASTASAGNDSLAVYDVVFDATWSSATHPGAYPAGAHFSTLVGGTHSDGVTFWLPGATASPGIEAMAELGSTGLLQGEVSNAIAAGTAATVVLGTDVPSSPGTGSASFVVTEDFPLVTLVTMVAPSPDWFVGVRDFRLFENDQWLDSAIIPLFAYDAGTDSGTNFTSFNQNTNPKVPIQLITSGPLGNGVPLGTFTFTRRTSTLVYGSGVNPPGSMSVVGGLPTLGQTVTLGLSDPTGTMLTPAATLLYITDAPSPFFPAGFSIPNVGLQAGAPGELLVDGTIILSTLGPNYNGGIALINIAVPPLAGLVSAKFYAQGVMIDPTPRLGLTDAVELFVGP